MSNSLSVINCRLSSESLNYQSVHISQGSFERIDKTNTPLPGYAVIDAGGRLVSPGLIDVHIQGAGGADVLDGTEEAFRTISTTCARCGVTSFLGSTLKLMTVAPELPGCLDIIREYCKQGVVCAYAHSAANYEQTKAGIDAGITQATHLFNAMQSIHHRAPGPVPALLEAKSVFCQVIPDGVHLHPSIIRMIWPALGPDRFVSITDGVRSLGLPDGNYEYNGLKFESRDGAARYHDGTLIGTAVGLNMLVKRLAKFTGCSIDDALRTATKTAAHSIGIEDKKGEIAVGKDADIVIFDEDLSVWKTIVGGETVYSKD
jgi:N-acetylglucosamine-6-phosphate deacetylase